ncbi:hypothetical protein [Gordonia westfalica]|uniref:Uncharacterized protein n=1 Tax=Gordonia westfalica TaxID=158898 RepID=A0A1H2HB74_9ACTN|nr:hypothetical protein [Gordonia westfalica]SDU29042.1 hypothetical protein SAMN04488548_134367 [Gordonia westfalica]
MAGLHRGGVVRIELCDFAFSGPAFIDVSEAALDRAAIGVGNLNAFVAGAPSTVKAIAQQWRSAITRDSIHPLGGRWWRSDNYARLERTEKGFMSGLLGGVLSKLVAESVFGVRQFGHIEYFSPPPIYDPTTRRRPDFLGLPAGGGPAVIVESKGRSDRLNASPDQVEKAKGQVRSVLRVPGCASVLRYVQYTHFTADGVLAVTLHDPPGSDDDGIAGDPSPLENDQRNVDLRVYYRDVVDAAVALNAQRVRLGGIRYQLFTYNLLGISVGVPDRIFQAVQQDQAIPAGSEYLGPLNTVDVAEDSRRWLIEESGRVVPSDTQVLSDVGPDGIAVVGSYPIRG